MKRRTLQAPADELAGKLAETLQDALRLLDDAAYTGATPQADNAEQATLLQHCLALCEQQQERPEPVRTVHHFACTGGTVISKCIAAMPNVQLLSEVDPLSTLRFDRDKPRFAPTDTVALMRQSTRGASDKLVEKLFHTQMRVMHAEATALGQRLVLRDHAHSHFCVGPAVPERPSFRELMPADMPLLSVVTVRHPLDSFASLSELGWIHFEPGNIDEYCKRYLAFLQRHDGIAIVRYEDLTAEPESTMRDVCRRLDLSFNDDFQSLFSVFRLTGDSGRSGDTLEPRARRPSAQALANAAKDSVHYAELISKLQYND